MEAQFMENITDCPLHNEGFDDEDGDKEDYVDQFISLANMCRGEQLFASYFEELNQHQEPRVDQPIGGDGGAAHGVGGVDVDAEGVVGEDDGFEGVVGEDDGAAGTRSMDPSPSSIPSTSTATKTNKRRKFSPVIDKASQDALRAIEEAEMLDGVRDGVGSDEEGGSRRGPHCRSFKLTNDLPQWNVGDLFGDRNFFREVLRQYTVMSKRPVRIKLNDRKRLQAVCSSGNGDCPWFVYLRKDVKHNPTDYVVQTLNIEHSHTFSEVQENRWISSKWLGQRIAEKIRANPHIPLTAIR